MPETNDEPVDEPRSKQQRQFSPSQSDSEHGEVPRERRTVAHTVGGEYDSVLSNKHPFPVEICKVEKVNLLRKIPIVKNPRMIELVAKFEGFPWAQDTVMAAHQLEEVLISFLYQTLEIPGKKLHRWRDSGELVQRALVELAEYETYCKDRPDINLLINEYKSQA